MFVLTNTAGASATTPPASKTTLFVDASGVPSTKSSGGTVTPLLTGPAAAAAYQPLDADLTGIAGLTYAADKSVYYTGSAWATYDLTGVGRTLLAATTQVAQRTALGLGTAATQNTGTSGTTVPLLDGANTWAQPQRITGRVTVDGPDNNWVTLRSRSVGDDVGGLWRATDAVSIINTVAGFRGIRVADSGGHITPTGDNVQTGGSATNRYSQLFAANATINTSDARLKTEPRQMSEAERKAGSELARLPSIWKWLTGDRLHAGPTVQAAMAVMKAHRLDPFAYSFICYDEWEAEPEQWHEWEAEVDTETGEVTREAGRELIQPAREAGDRYSFRKEELLCFMVSALATENDLQAAKVAALDARLAALEAKA